MLESLLLPLAILGVVAALVGSYVLKRRRREALAAVANGLGLSFSPEDASGCLALPFALLQRGDGRGTENVMSGTWNGMPVLEFDYWYDVESTDSEGRTSRTTYRFSCAVTEVEATLAPLVLERENLFTRLADSLGLADIEFELDEFNRAFTVKCRDRRFAFDFVDQRMMRWLMDADRACAFEASGRWLLAYSKRRRPTELIPLLGALQRFREQVPTVVYELYGPASSG